LDPSGALGGGVVDRKGIANGEAVHAANPDSVRSKEVFAQCSLGVPEEDQRFVIIPDS